MIEQSELNTIQLQEPMLKGLYLGTEILLIARPTRLRIRPLYIPNTANTFSGRNDKAPFR